MLDAEVEPEQKRTALDVCKEFVGDVAAAYEDVGPHSELGDVWPDLLVTYYHAKEVVASAETVENALLAACKDVRCRLNRTANGGLRRPGTIDKVGDHKHMERVCRDILSAAIALVEKG